MAARKKRKRKRNRGRLAAFFKLLCIVAVVVAVTMGATVFFQIENIVVQGNGRYSQQEIIDASGLQIGDNLFHISTYQIEQQICQQLPYVGEVKIQRGLPNTVTLSVEEWQAVARVEVYSQQTETADEETQDEEAQEESETQIFAQTDQPWLISATGKILEAGTGSLETMSVRGLTILAPQIGFDMAVPQEQRQRRDTLLELLDIMAEQGILNQVSEIDLTNQLWIGLVYRENFQVRLPQGEDYGRSIKLMMAAVEDTVQTRGEQSSGLMDLTQQGYDAIFTPANS